uniref:F-box domain-containing protein n=1 Tax=Setaria italica TaxID=4555 RepID=K3ZMI0_SETIT
MGSDSGAVLAGGGGGGGGDRLSGFGDAVLVHVLSFLPADEAVRAAALSRRWRDVPGYGGPINRNPGVPTPPVVNTVSAALFCRLRSGGGPAAAVPLRVRFQAFSGLNAGLVDMWLCCAMRQAGDELHVDLHLRGEVVCRRGYSLRRSVSAAHADKEDGGQEEPASDGGEYDYYNKFGSYGGDKESDSDADGEDDDDPALPESEPADDSDEEEPPPPYKNDAVQRLVSACPRLADLTLESFEKLTKLAILGTRLRRLALRCCHDLAAVAADSSELRAFEYRGAVPAPSFLALRGGARKISSCALDFCGAEATDPPKLARLGDFLRLFVGVKRLQLTSARLGGAGGALAFPAFPKLHHLGLTGMLPEDDTAAVATVTRVLKRTPSMETLTLFFLPEPEDLEDSDYYYIDEEELLDGHKLKYDRHAPLAVPEVEILCLRERTKEISFVHYEGNLAQRTLAKFLLRNAPVVDEVCGEFAQGPLRIQTRLMEEIKGWVVNKSANTMFF